MSGDPAGDESYLISGVGTIMRLGEQLISATLFMENSPELLTAPAVIHARNDLFISALGIGQTDEFKLALQEFLDGAGDLNKEDFDQKLRALEQLATDSNFFYESLDFAIRRSKGRRSMATLAYRATLQIAVSSFEVHIQRLMRAYIARHPLAVLGEKQSDGRSSDSGDDEGAASFVNHGVDARAIMTSSSVEELQEQVIDKRIDREIRRGPEAWFEWFGKRTKQAVNRKEVVPDFVEFQEIFERRNCFIHHDGHASRQYVSFSRRLRSPVAPGSRLDLSREYLRSSIADLFTVGATLARALFLHMDGQTDKDVLNAMIYLISADLETAGIAGLSNRDNLIDGSFMATYQQRLKDSGFNIDS